MFRNSELTGAVTPSGKSGLFGRVKNARSEPVGTHSRGYSYERATEQIEID
jgi:hypothetical protein